MIDDVALGALEDRVVAALRTGAEDRLDVIGYGEVSTVLRADTSAGPVACKRLPRFADEQAFASYAQVFHDYLDALRRAGVDVVDSELRALRRDGAIVAYCVQPLLDPDTLAPRVLARAEPGPHPVLDEIARLTAAVCTPEVGLDAQLANWAYDGTRLSYLDVTTPFLRTPTGRLRLDLHLFAAALPAALRPVLLRFVLPGVERRYHDRRAVLVDVAGNLHKERLAAWVEPWLEVANRQVEQPIDAAEVRRFYAGDARLWALLLWVRRADRAWQRRVRRRPYAIVLPGRIER
jgi:hypothetical protein